MQLILQKGIVDGVRSEVMAMPGQMNGEEVWFLIAGATMVEAAFQAFAMPEAKDAGHFGGRPHARETSGKIHYLLAGVVRATHITEPSSTPCDKSSLVGPCVSFAETILF